MKVKRFVEYGTNRHLGYSFECPGCGEMHCVYTNHSRADRNWTFNGDMERPTFSPSIKVTGTVPVTDEEIDRIMKGEKIDPKPRICHSYVEEGQIRFLGDCTHELANQTVELPCIGQDS